MTDTRGKLITLEGIEGTGKSTAIPLLTSWIVDQGHRCIQSREPGGTRIAERIRALLLTPDPEAMSPASEFLLMAAARKQHVDNLIRPALERGTWVVLDRFTDSSIAYQGYGRGVDLDFIERTHAFLLHDLVPDLTLWFDLDIATSRDRVTGRQNALLDQATTSNQAASGDRFETLGDAFFQRVQQGFTRIHTTHPERVVRIDARQSKEMVGAQVITAIRQRFAA